MIKVWTDGGSQSHNYPEGVDVQLRFAVVSHGDLWLYVRDQDQKDLAGFKADRVMKWEVML